MKHSFRNLFAITCMALSFALSSCSDDDEGDDVTPDQEQAGGSECLVDVEAVDLGLPSGTRWAPMNIGATYPEGYGDYFAWGETTTKRTYDQSTYKWMNGQTDQIIKYTYDDGQISASWYDENGNFIGDGKTTLDPADDAATANWGSAWRMPTVEEWTELYEKCAWTWQSANGVEGVGAGYSVTGPSGNSIFLPAAGLRHASLKFDSGNHLYDAGTNGYYWSSDLYADNSVYACDCYFLRVWYTPNIIIGGCTERYTALPVRAVATAK